MPVVVPPYYPSDYTPQERALIAGYLIHQREGTLKALRSLSSIAPGTTEGLVEGELLYYKNAERYSRFLLYWIGYPVGKGENYEPT